MKIKNEQQTPRKNGGKIKEKLVFFFCDNGHEEKWLTGTNFGMFKLESAAMIY